MLFHSYEGGDGTKAYERGQLKESNGGAGNAVEGNYSYKVIQCFISSFVLIFILT